MAPLTGAVERRLLAVLASPGLAADAEAVHLPWSAMALAGIVRALGSLVFALEAEDERLHTGALRDLVLRRIRRALFPAGRT